MFTECEYFLTSNYVRFQVLRAQVAAPGKKVVAGLLHEVHGGLILRGTPLSVSQLHSPIRNDAVALTTAISRRAKAMASSNPAVISSMSMTQPLCLIESDDAGFVGA